jgi:hypothetical protein
MHIILLQTTWGDLVVKILFPSLGFKDQFPQMTWIVISVGMLIEYSLSNLTNIGCLLGDFK